MAVTLCGNPHQSQASTSFSAPDRDGSIEVLLVFSVCLTASTVASPIRDELWADGTVADTHAFLLDLRPQASKHAAKPVLDRFKEALPFLSSGMHAPPRQDDDSLAHLPIQASA
ncbi:MAG: hypothetical protein WBX25_28105 [Rhodomicrobium sp.]